MSGGGGPSTRSPSARATWSQSGAAASGGRSPRPHRASAACPLPAPPPAACRWDPPDRALANQLVAEAAGCPATAEPGPAALRFSNPTAGGDVLPTIRAELHRLRPGTETVARREVGSSVWQVFAGT